MRQSVRSMERKSMLQRSMEADDEGTKPDRRMGQVDRQATNDVMPQPFCSDRIYEAFQDRPFPRSSLNET